MLFSILHPIARLVLWIFFRRIEIKIDDQVVTDRPCIFVANHPNAMLDAILLGLYAPAPTLRFIGNSTLFRRPLSAWLLQQLGVIPVVRRQDEGSQMANRALLHLASQTLEDGGSLVLFPEGVSHTVPKVLDLKPGAARIALRTEVDTDGRLGIHIIPVGLTYSAPTLFRGDVAVHFGEPIEVRSFLATYREDRDAAEDVLTDLIHERLIALTWHIENPGLETVIRDLSVIYAEKIVSKLPDSVEFSKQLRAEQEIIRAVHYFTETDPELVQSFATRLRSHHRKLKLHRLEPSAIDPAIVSPRAKYLLLAVLFFPLALYGFIHNAIPYYLTRFFARSYWDEPVKIGTVKLFTGIILFPFFYLLLIGVASPFTDLSLTFLYGLTFPLSGLFALLYSEKILQKWPLWLSFVLPQKHKYYLKRLTKERMALICDLDTIKERYIEVLTRTALVQ